MKFVAIKRDATGDVKALAEEIAPAARLRLRRFAEADASALFGMYSHPKVMRYWSRPAMTDPDKAGVLIRQILADYETAPTLPS
jgi:RimJ/RimL family protein N-acetyltransferase